MDSMTIVFQVTTLSATGQGTTLKRAAEEVYFNGALLGERCSVTVKIEASQSGVDFEEEIKVADGLQLRELIRWLK